MVPTDDHTRLIRALLSAVTDLDELSHPRHAGRVLLAAAVAGKSCSDDALARAASMPVAIVREIIPANRLTRDTTGGCSDDTVGCATSMPVAMVRDVLPSMLDRCPHVAALFTAKTNRTPSGPRTPGFGSRVRDSVGCCLWGTV